MAESSSEHELISPKINWAEENPNSWWLDVVKTVRRCLAKSSVDPGDIMGVCVSGQFPTMVLVDKNGEPTRNAILYNDPRAVEEMDWVRRNVGEDRIFDVTGFPVQAQLWGPKILWVSKHDSQSFTKTYKLLGANDFVIQKLTGEFVTDINTALEAGLLNFKKKDWWLEFCERVGISIDMLPELYEPQEVVGEVRREAAKETGLAEGTPVVAGSGDTLCSALAAGVVDVDQLMLMYGTTGCFLLCTDRIVHDRRFYFDYHVVPGVYALNGCMATSGLLLRWFKNNFAQEEVKTTSKREVNPYSFLDSKAGNIKVGSDGLIILPYFLGEKTPVNDPHARGVIFGLTLSHSKNHIFRALLEAVAYGFNHQIEILRELNCRPKKIIAVNGGAKSRIWRQIVTDVIGIPQEYLCQNPGAPLGDAFLAAIGTGQVKDWHTIEDWIKDKEVTEPNQMHHKQYQRLYTIYRQIYEHLKADFFELSKLTDTDSEIL